MGKSMIKNRSFDFVLFLLLLQQANGEFKQAVNVRGSIHSIAIDYVQKALLIGTQDTLKVFDMDEYTCVQVNEGHTDVIR